MGNNFEPVAVMFGFLAGIVFILTFQEVIASTQITDCEKLHSKKCVELVVPVNVFKPTVN